jgi:hypothetical protein
MGRVYLNIYTPVLLKLEDERSLNLRSQPVKVTFI